MRKTVLRAVVYTDGNFRVFVTVNFQSVELDRNRCAVCTVHPPLRVYGFGFVIHAVHREIDVQIFIAAVYRDVGIKRIVIVDRFRAHIQNAGVPIVFGRHIDNIDIVRATIFRTRIKIHLRVGVLCQIPDERHSPFHIAYCIRALQRAEFFFDRGERNLFRNDIRGILPRIDDADGHPLSDRFLSKLQRPFQGTLEARRSVACRHHVCGAVDHQNILV